MASAEQASFGALLRRLRLAAGLTQEGLAERAGVSSKAVSGLERDAGRTPRLETVTLLADALGLHGAERADLLAAARPQDLPPAGPAPAVRPRVRLPHALTPLIGRAEDAQTVAGLLQRPDRRLVTLTGPGGVGKTRLAIHVGEHLAPAFPDGVVFVDLAPVREAALVLPTLAHALGIVAVGGRSLQDSLIDQVQSQALLVVLDNVEHISDAGPALLPVLEGDARLKVLATSRAPLRLRGEHLYHLAPLALPQDALSLQVVARSPAVALFLDRAGASGAVLRLDMATAATVVEICRRLDGLPLAIELAAAWARVFSPQALLRRLVGADLGAAARSPLHFLSGRARDVPRRHQTLHQVVDWSYRLLPDQEQRLFARLAVFAGGWTLEAAEAVLGAVPGDPDVLEGIVSLLDKNLVRKEDQAEGEPRFTMLETIREYAREQLAALGEEARGVHRRHAAYALALAREAAANMWGRDRGRWQQRLQQEAANLRAALVWGRDHGEVEMALQLGGALFWFWQEGGYWTEARDLLETTLAASPAHRTVDRAAALDAAAICNWSLGNVAVARAQTEESLAICRELGDRRGMGHALHGLGVLAAERGDLAGARALIEDGMAHSEAAGDRPFVGLALHNLGLFAVREGDEATARARIETSRRVWEELGSTPYLSMVAASLGHLARARGAFAEAAAQYREALDLIGVTGPPAFRASALCNLGHVTARQGDTRHARALLLQALDLCREFGDRRGVAESVAGLACVLAPAQPARAARLLGAAMVTIEAAGSHLMRTNQADYDLALATARSQGGDAAVDAAWRQGRSWSLEDAVRDALVDDAPYE